jgi:hypothetical protein
VADMVQGGFWPGALLTDEKDDTWVNDLGRVLAGIWTDGEKLGGIEGPEGRFARASGHEQTAASQLLI